MSSSQHRRVRTAYRLFNSVRIAHPTFVVIAFVIAAAASAQPYPTKPIRFLVGFPPGGGNDSTARLVSARMAEGLKQSVVIDNRPGAGGNLAAEITAKAPADGHTMLLISSSHPIQGLLKKNLAYDPLRDFAGVAQLVTYRSLLIAHPGFAAKTVAELIALAKEKPGTIHFVSSGNGSASHLADRKSTRLNSSHVSESRMPSSA